MKPHLPLTLLVALLGSFVSQAVEIPDNYEQIDLWTPSYLNDYISNSEEDNYAFILWTDVDFTPTTNPSWSNTAALVTGGNHIFTNSEESLVSLSFQNGTSSVFKSVSGLLFDTLFNLDISYQNCRTNACVADLVNGNLELKNIKDISDSTYDIIVNNNTTLHSADKYGGVIAANSSSSNVNLINNGSICFGFNKSNILCHLDGVSSDNSVSKNNYGGVIYAVCAITVEDNHKVEFFNNEATANTSIAAGTFNSSLELGNKSIVKGGAIWSSSNIDLLENNIIDFTGNICSSQSSAKSNRSAISDAISYGGAIFSETSLEITKNGSVFFQGNGVEAQSSTIDNYSSINSAPSPSKSYAYGGAIFSNGSIVISENESVTFESNFACGKSTSTSNNGYANVYGGGIYSTDSLAITNNLGDVKFCSNSVSAGVTIGQPNVCGGAIYSTGIVKIEGNENVIFEKNYEKKDGSSISYCLRGLYMNPDNGMDLLSLSAKTGGEIVFYDSVYVGKDYYSEIKVSFNADYQDAADVTQKAKGDIIFSGKYTKEHLDSIIAADTAEGKTPRTATSTEITNSQTSQIYNLITLYGGSLQVVDGAKLNGRGLTVAADSGAKLLLRDGSMSHSSYQFTFNNDTTLELQGLNTITASKITLASGSALTVTVGEDNLNTAALTLGGTDLATSKLTVNLKREDGLTSGKYKIISQSSASDFTTKSAWTAENVTVNGSGYANRAIFSDLVWENGTLYYSVGRTIWGNASGDRLWNTSSDNWTMNDRSYTYLDGMDVSFTDLGAGEVKLVGDIAPASIEVNNSEGNDYIFAAAAGGGKLVGTTGITKNGTGTLTLTTANTHTGATVLNGGTLNVHHSTALGATASAETATVTTAVGTTLAVGNKSHVVLAAENDIKGAVSVAEGATLELRNKGYTAESSNIAGTLHFKGAAAATSKVGTLSGTGSVKVEDSSVTVAEIKGYTGKLSVQGNNAALNITKGNYSGAGSIGVMGANAALNMSSSNITLRSGGVLSLTGSITDSIAQAALLDANNVTISNGAELAVKAITVNSPVQNLSAAFTIDTTPSTGYDASRAYNVLAGGKIDAALLTLAAGATYTANAANVSLSDGELTLAITSTATKRIELNLTLSADYDPAAQVVLFSDVTTVNFIKDGLTAKSTDGAVYTLSAADYFNSVWINNLTTLVYDSNQKVVYLEGVSNVPEPTSSMLGLVGLVAFALRRRRK